MGKNETMKKYVIISGLNLNDNNRGTAALGYGALSFCSQHKYLQEGQELVNFHFVKRFWKKEFRDKKTKYLINGKSWEHNICYIKEWEKFIYIKFNILLPFTKFRKIIKNLDIVAAINGGDGFSDIYDDASFHYRLIDTEIAMKEKIPVIILPQTIGPFKKKDNFNTAKSILQYAMAVYVRDNKFVPELDKMQVKYELTKDLSAYMQPEPWDIKIQPNSIGINVSGLAYSNRFRTLSGQFESYPKLIDCLISHFLNKGHTVYLIPHSFDYKHPEKNNDDMVACRTAYQKLSPPKKNVIVVDKDMTAPQIKYVISQMNFFIGTRMHANFAAIYTNVPLFGLAYSYKFEGAFDANGLNGKEQTAIINNITPKDIDTIIEKIEKVYKKTL